MKYQTVCTVAYSCAVSRNQNRAAHGAVCHIQIARREGRVFARKVNSNGRHQEIGEPFTPTAEQLARWNEIARSQR